jgi:GAF domain-containing protein
MTNRKSILETLPGSQRVAGTSALDAWRSRSLNILLAVAAVLALPAVAFIVHETVRESGPWMTVAGFIVLYVILVALAIFRRVDSRLRAVVLLIIVYAGGVLGLGRGGLAGDGRLYLFSVPILALVLINTQAGLIATAITLVTFLGFAVMTDLGWTDTWLFIRDNPTSLSVWLDSGITLAMMMIPIVVLLRQFTRFQMSTLQKEHEVAEKLAETSESLRDRAQETEETNRVLREQAGALAAAAEVAQKTASLTDAEELMNEFVTLIAHHFSLYHTGLFLIDPDRNVAVLRAASSMRGKEMVNQGYQVPVGAENLVGQVAYAGEIRIARVEPGSMPGFPQSKWRVTAPVQTANTTIGVLDFHLYIEEEPSSSVVRALGMLADQLAVGLAGIQRLEQLESSLEELSRLNRLMTGETWEQYTQELPGGARRHTSGQEMPAAAWETAFIEAQDRGQAIQTTRTVEGAGGRQMLAVPVRLRGTPIGVIGFHRADDEEKWSLQEIDLAERMVDRFAQTLENIRLLEETRRRATRERVISEISSRLRTSLDPDVILRTTVQELGRVLNAEMTSVEITGPEGGNGNPPPQPAGPREEV